MPSVAMEELKDRLDEYVRRAAAGETVLVTEDDRVVAEIRAPRPAVPADHPLADMIREGLVQPATLPRGTRPRRHGIAKLSELLAELDEDRADR